MSREHWPKMDVPEPNNNCRILRRLQLKMQASQYCVEKAQYLAERRDQEQYEYYTSMVERIRDQAKQTVRSLQLHIQTCYTCQQTLDLTTKEYYGIFVPGDKHGK